MAEREFPAEVFSVFDIEKWSSTSEIAIPALQRGLVWEPSQIELLWDSLFRGIPIGAFVICKCIQGQKIDSSQEKTKFHLLDGQQRVNAIQLAFDRAIDNPKGAMLWLDLKPDLLKTSTRNFLFRVTTPAHPWGYKKTDDSDRLDVNSIRKLLDEYHFDPSAEGYTRPKPAQIRPYDACYPIPMSVLWEIYKTTLNSSVDLLEAVKLRCQKCLQDKYKTVRWAEIILAAIENGELGNLDLIREGLETASQAQIIALKTPDNLLRASAQEEANESGGEDITSIEHLFQRLNRRGTRLDGEELIYSMIKAYWPEIRQGIDKIEAECKLMQSSRLVSLAIRTILTENRTDDSIEPPLTVNRIRRLAREDDAVKKQIIEFVNENDGLRKCCKQIDVLLGVCGKDNGIAPNWGLPPVLRSSVAYNMPDFYLLLILLVRKQQMPEESIRKEITGLITWAKWFGCDEKQLIMKIYCNIKYSRHITANLLSNIVHDEEKIISVIPSPADLNNFLSVPAPGCVSTWNFWSLIADDDEARQNEKFTKWWSFIESLRANREILIYAQRDFIRRRFPMFDPSRKDLWEEHNRPWDYDHIFAKKFAHRVMNNNTFLNFCQQWRDSNGNMRAWPFEDNRSDQCDPANVKISHPDILRDSFIEEDELPGFSTGYTAVADENSALEFASSCKKRLVRIYRSWYEMLDVGALVKYNETFTKPQV